jgi:hypothetical protein
VEIWRARFEDELLADYAVGGVQTRALTELVALARADGLRPVLYDMPVMDAQREFHSPEIMAAYVAQRDRIARALNVPFVSLDRDHGFAVRDFHDVSHLAWSAHDEVSRRFAAVVRRALAPG